jgi:hypothetical protein
LPNIDQIPQVLYEPTDPYYYLVDNVPLINILNKIELINDAVDIASDQLRDAVGSAGTLANRLESLNADGSINPNAIDSAMHNIGYHVDGIGPDSVPYVRMQDAERDKLATVADGATDIILQFDVQTNGSQNSISGSGTIPIQVANGIVEFIPSSGITWSTQGGNKFAANLNFSTGSIHRHFYDQQAYFFGNSPDYINYLVSSSMISYIEGSLRVYINGFRISEVQGISVPIGTNPVTPTVIQYTENALAGSFALSSAISASDIIRIDFDILIN